MTLGTTLALVLHRIGITGRARCRVLQLRMLISQVPESRQRLQRMLWSRRHQLASFSRPWRKRCRRRVLMRVRAKVLHFGRPAHLGLPSARICHRSRVQMRKLDVSRAIKQPMADMLRALSRPRAQRSSKTRTERNDRNEKKAGNAHLIPHRVMRQPSIARITGIAAPQAGTSYRLRIRSTGVPSFSGRASNRS